MTIRKLINIVFLFGLLVLPTVWTVGQSVLVKGHVYQDLDFNCQKAVWETTTLSNIIVKAEKGNWSNYTTTDINGYYELLVDTGACYISMTTPSPYWWNCNDSTIVNFATADTTILNLGNWSFLACPLLHVGVSTPVLQPCQASTYMVSYCNIGTANASMAYVDVQLDSFLSLDSASAPLIGQIGYQLYRFDIGNVPLNSCGAFQVHTTLACGTLIGQTHCVEAHIYPDTVCIPGSSLNWDESDIKITVECNLDSIRFHIENIGSGSMNMQRAYFVAEDEIMLKTGTYQLNSGQIETISVPTNGISYHMQAQQDPAHPLRPFVSVGFDGCGSLVDTTGLLLQYPLENYLPFVDYDCQQNVAQFPELRTTGYPIGYGSNHYIPSIQPLEYHIQFQYRGLNTANTVLIVDTLPAYLDISSLQMMSCSHAYSWTLEGNVLKIQFDNIQLPNSSVDAHHSKGFARFYILQKQGNPDGTIIENNAQVYFDGQLRTSNTTFHEIKGDAYTSILTHTVFQKTVERLSVSIFPNPFDNYINIQIKNPIAFNSSLFRLWNAQGQLVCTKNSSEQQFVIHPSRLSSGVYFYTLEIDGNIAQTGQLIAK